MDAWSTFGEFILIITGQNPETGSELRVALTFFGLLLASGALMSLTKRDNMFGAFVTVCLISFFGSAIIKKLVEVLT